MRTIREIRVKDLFTYFVIPLLSVIAIWLGFALFSDLIPYLYIKLFLILLFALITFLLLKPLVIGSVLMYKAFAPKSVRDRCRFEPTCSTYMIMAINKYGLIKGVFKGIKRITHCKPPNGGIDYP